MCLFIISHLWTSLKIGHLQRSCTILLTVSKWHWLLKLKICSMLKITSWLKTLFYRLSILNLVFFRFQVPSLSTALFAWKTRWWRKRLPDWNASTFFTWTAWSNGWRFQRCAHFAGRKLSTVFRERGPPGGAIKLIGLEFLTDDWCSEFGP